MGTFNIDQLVPELESRQVEQVEQSRGGLLVRRTCAAHQFPAPVGAAEQLLFNGLKGGTLQGMEWETEMVLNLSAEFVQEFLKIHGENHIIKVQKLAGKNCFVCKSLSNKLAMKWAKFISIGPFSKNNANMPRINWPIREIILAITLFTMGQFGWIQVHFGAIFCFTFDTEIVFLHCF